MVDRTSMDFDIIYRVACMGHGGLYEEGALPY